MADRFGSAKHRLEGDKSLPPLNRPEFRKSRREGAYAIEDWRVLSQNSRMSSPNILLIHSDQHRYDCLGANGHPFLKTPNLDRLAGEGVDFSHAFCPIPLCTPARSCLLSGQWSFRHGCIANSDTEAFRPMAEDTPVFSTALRDRGYFLGYIGKWHVDAARGPTEYGFHTYTGERVYAGWRKNLGLPPVPRSNAWFGETDPHITPEQSRLAWGADRVIDLLEERSASQPPFFIRWDPSEPHLPNCVPEPYASMYPAKMIPEWPGFRESFDRKPFIQRQQLHTWGLTDWTWDDWAPVVSRYLGEISLLDAQIGRVLEALDRSGAGKETLVVYTSDHGDMCGSHRMIDKHFVMYDDVVRVPLIMRPPGEAASGRISDAFVSSAIDLASTICEVAGAVRPESFMGKSLLPLLGKEAERDNGRSDIFSAYHGNQFGLYSQRMVRDRRWKYVWNAVAEDELYDLEADPGELMNRAADPAASAELRRLQKRLVHWMEGTGDRLLNQWTRKQLEEGKKAGPARVP